LEKAQPHIIEKTTRRFQPVGEVACTMKDIHHNWLNVIRRIQSVGRSRNVVGCAIVSINVVINERGVPLLWSEPKCTLLEPMKDNMMLLDLLKKEL
jgi:hypothetical protein